MAYAQNGSADATPSDSISPSLDSIPQVVRRPSQRELYPLHRELQIWMALSKYQLQGLEHRPVWTVNNTSLTLSMGSGLGCHALIRQYRPSWTSLPKQVIPPFAAFYLAFQAAQAIQLPWLYDRLLTSPSPLGHQSRELLNALRTGARLPSADWERERAAQAAKRAEAPGTAGDKPDERPSVRDVTPPPPTVDGWGVAPPAPPAEIQSSGFTNSADVGKEQVATMGWDTPLSLDDGDMTSEPNKSRKQVSWDEIRARGTK